MAGIYNGPVREGARGGRDQFKWEDIKNQPDKNYYLGASVKAVSGRWQKDKDVFWYTKEKSSGTARQDEIQAVKEKEQALMNQALGIPASTLERRRKEDTERRKEKKRKKRRHRDESAEKRRDSPSSRRHRHRHRHRSEEERKHRKRKEEH